MSRLGWYGDPTSEGPGSTGPKQPGPGYPGPVPGPNMTQNVKGSGPKIHCCNPKKAHSTLGWF